MTEIVLLIIFVVCWCTCGVSGHYHYCLTHDPRDFRCDKQLALAVLIGPLVLMPWS